MRDAARHLAERAQALLLHDLLLRLAQVVVGLLQGAVQLRLVRGQRGVLAGLAQELAFAAAEGVGARAARQISTPNTWLSTSSGAMTSERMPALARRCGNGNRGSRDVGLVDQVSAARSARARSRRWARRVFLLMPSALRQRLGARAHAADA